MAKKKKEEIILTPVNLADYVPKDELKQFLDVTAYNSIERGLAAKIKDLFKL